MNTSHTWATEAATAEKGTARRHQPQAALGTRLPVRMQTTKENLPGVRESLSLQMGKLRPRAWLDSFYDLRE